MLCCCPLSPSVAHDNPDHQRVQAGWFKSFQLLLAGDGNGDGDGDGDGDNFLLIDENP